VRACSRLADRLANFYKLWYEYWTDPNIELIKIQTANLTYFQRKIQLSGVSAYPDGSPSQLIRISGVE
jgi:hypothetical protein